MATSSLSFPHRKKVLRNQFVQPVKTALIFTDSTESILKKLHKTSVHKGDMSSTPSKLDKLKLELRDAIESENFEKAAELRDEIRTLEGGEK